MSPVIPIIFAAALGFGLGYKLKDCLCRKEKTSNLPDIRSLTQEHPNASTTTSRSDTVFSLHSIDKLFSQFNIPLTSDYSFSRLLDAIEKNSYVSLLKNIDTRITSPDELFCFLENAKFDVASFEIVNSNGEPYLTQDNVNTILEKNSVEYTHLKTIEEKVNFLLMLAQGKGVKRFRESFGNDLTLFLNKYSKGEKTDVVFESIKTTIHNRLEILS